MNIVLEYIDESTGKRITKNIEGKNSIYVYEECAPVERNNMKKELPKLEFYDLCRAKIPNGFGLDGYGYGWVNIKDYGELNVDLLDNNSKIVTRFSFDLHCYNLNHIKECLQKDFESRAKIDEWEIWYIDGLYTKLYPANIKATIQIDNDYKTELFIEFAGFDNININLQDNTGLILKDLEHAKSDADRLVKEYLQTKETNEK